MEIKGKEIPVYERDAGILELIKMIGDKLKLQDTVTIAVAGGSASGKTSAIAARIYEAFRQIGLLYSIDDYYFGIEYMNAHKELNWDQPQAINLALFARQLAELKAGNPIEKPIYRFTTGRSEGTETLYPKRVIIFEGLFALDDSINGLADIGVFVDIGVHGRIIRRILRDVERTGQRPADILKQFAETVQPMHEIYIESTKGNADVIINNEYIAEVEANRAGLFEVQMKFPLKLDTEDLRKTGATRIGLMADQVDIYYNPIDRDLRGSDESLRIREEGGKCLVIGYKGPRLKGSRFRKRPKVEFEIDRKTKEKFLAIYGNQFKTIRKERVLYILDGVLFSIDKVEKIENAKTTYLGEFLEIREVAIKNASKPEIEAALENVLEKLGLDIAGGIKESYVEM